MNGVFWNGRNTAAMTTAASAMSRQSTAAPGIGVTPVRWPAAAAGHVSASVVSVISDLLPMTSVARMLQIPQTFCLIVPCYNEARRLNLAAWHVSNRHSPSGKELHGAEVIEAIEDAPHGIISKGLRG